MSDSPPAGSSRWHTILLAVLGGVGGFASIAGTLFVVTGWPAHVNDKLDQYGKRLDQVEANERTYIPVVVGMQVDLRYLADRARREDDARAQERR